MYRFLLVTTSVAVLSLPVWAQTNDYATDYIDEAQAAEQAAPAVKETVELTAPQPTQAQQQAPQPLINTVPQAPMVKPAPPPPAANLTTEELIIPPPMDPSAQEMEADMMQDTGTASAPSVPASAPAPAVNTNANITGTTTATTTQAPQVISPAVPLTQEEMQKPPVNENNVVRIRPQSVQDAQTTRSQAASQTTPPTMVDEASRAPVAPSATSPNAPMSAQVAPAPSTNKATTTQAAPALSAFNSGLCQNGQAQSPINIALYQPDETLEKIETAYKPVPVSVENTGKTIAAIYAPGNFARIKGSSYEIKSINFHTPSEHYFKGVPYAMEAHLMHESPDGKKGIIAVLMKVGEVNPTIESIWKTIPPVGEKKTSTDYIDATSFLPEGRKYFMYDGSLTHAPCTEGVTWIVMQEPLEISQAQLNAFQKLYPANARPIQIQGSRIVKGN